MVTAALWLRVSDPGQHTENKRPDLEAFIKRKGWELGPVYDLQASAFRGNHRAMLGKVYQDARLGKFDVLIVWALDRLTREGVAATFEIVNHLGREGVKVVSVMESWTEQDGPMCDLLLSVFSWVAQYESRRRSERTKAGLARASKKGHRPGRPAVVESVDLELVGRLRSEGKSWTAIHQAHPRTVRTRSKGTRRQSIASIRRALACQNGAAEIDGAGTLGG